MEERNLELIEIEPPFRDENGKYIEKRAVLRCYCGTIFKTRLSSFNNKTTRSCGCLFKEIRKSQKPNFRDGWGRHPLMIVYHGMMDRCYNSNNQSFERYGGRGIHVCEEWRADHMVFINWCLSNGWIKGLHLDRKKNNEGYSPSNCRFVTPAVNNNNKRSNAFIEYDGTTLTLTQWANKLNIPYGVLYRNYNTYNHPISICFTSKTVIGNRKNKFKKMIDKDLAASVKAKMKEDGRRQRWFVDKMIDAGIEISETKMSNKLNGVMEFSQVELDFINSILNTDFNISAAH